MRWNLDVRCHARAVRSRWWPISIAPSGTAASKLPRTPSGEGIEPGTTFARLLCGGGRGENGKRGRPVLNGGVLVAGAINTDLVARVQRAPAAGETITGQSFQIFGGGKGANQALACARSGSPTMMLGAVGNDEFGKQRLADLRADGIDIESVVLSDTAASGVALIVVEASGEHRIAYVPGATATVSADDALAAIRHGQSRIVLSTIKLPAPALGALFRQAQAMG